MVLQLPHVEGGFGVTFNDITKDDAFYATEYFTFCDLVWYDCGCPRMIFRTHPQGRHPRLCFSVTVTYTPRFLPTALVGTRGGHISRNETSQQKEDTDLFLPQLNRLNEVFLVRGEDVSDVTVTPIPLQHRLTHQIITHY